MQKKVSPRETCQALTFNSSSSEERKKPGGLRASQSLCSKARQRSLTGGITTTRHKLKLPPLLRPPSLFLTAKQLTGRSPNEFEVQSLSCMNLLVLEIVLGVNVSERRPS